MDKQIPTNGEVMPGISMANGEVKVEDTAMTDVNDTLANGSAHAKRKGRQSIMRPDYAEAESSDDDLPLVWKEPILTHTTPQNILAD